jgi:hypothetical protein
VAMDIIDIHKGSDEMMFSLTRSFLPSPVKSGGRQLKPNRPSNSETTPPNPVIEGLQGYGGIEEAR